MRKGLGVLCCLVALVSSAMAVQQKVYVFEEFTSTT
jgi:hypothetical protein